MMMEPIEIFVRIRGKDELVKIPLIPAISSEKDHDLLWESEGEYYIEAFQCGSNPAICSIEKDIRIMNTKEEISRMILNQIFNSISVS